MSTTSRNNDIRFKVIIKTSQDLEKITEELNHVDRLNSSLEEEYLKDLSDSTMEAIAIINQTNPRKQYLEILQQAENIESILSLPAKLEQYVQECQSYETAANLLEQVDLLYQKNSHHLPLIDEIHKQSNIQRKTLINNLCSRLHNLRDSSGDQIITIVNLLIKCGNFSARELRLKYLQGRDIWFKNTCKQQGTSFDKLVAVYCNGLTMIYEEYKRIFNDSNESLDLNHMSISSADTAKEDGAIINSWLLLKTTIFLASLDAYLKTFNQKRALTPSTLADTMRRCFDLTHQLSNIGFDFSAQLRPLFYWTLSEEIRSFIELTTKKFESSFATIASKSIESLLLPVDDEILRISRLTEELPKSINLYPIFKVYCLNMKESLRWITATSNILSPINLCTDVFSAMNSSLTRVMKALEVVLNTDNNYNHPILSNIAISFLTEVLPHLASYCDQIFPERAILSAIGLTRSEFKTICANEPHKLKNFRLDLRHIAEPLRKTMPAIMQTLEH